MVLLSWVVLVPALVVVLGVLVLRRPAWQVALTAALAAVATDVFVGGWGPLRSSGGATVGAAALLTLDAAVIIWPGLVLNEVLRSRGVHAELVAWVESWPVAPPVAGLILTTGFAPALESITGFGVSLLVTVPVLLALLPRKQALTGSMLSLTIMPWGTAGLASRVAAEVSGVPLSEVGVQSAMFSAAVFPAFAMVNATVMAPPDERRRTVGVGLGLGVLFSVVLWLMNLLGLVPLAGVAAGGVTAGAGYGVLVAGRARTSAVPWRALAPFGGVVALIVAERIGDALTGWGRTVALQVGQVRFEPLLSPGLAIVVVAAVAGRGVLIRGDVAKAVAGGWRPVVSLFGFALSAQVMGQSGAVAGLAGGLAHTGRAGLVLISPVLAVASGYLVGSNTGANALMALPQHVFGQGLGLGNTAVALQNSGAGHAVFASIPETLLVLAIAGDARRDEETLLTRFGAKMLVLVLALMVAAAAWVTLAA